jgi:hypothetical protein
MIASTLARAHRFGRAPQAPAELRCHSCGRERAPNVRRCDECAAIHRIKANAAGAELREACGQIPKVCTLCEGTCPGRHNRRTCPLRKAA